MSYASAVAAQPAQRLTAARFVTRPTPIYVIGDSHSLVFADLLFEEPKFFKQHFLTKARYLSGFSASAFSDGHSQLNTSLLQALLAEGLIDVQMRPSHFAADEAAQNEARAADRSRIEPILLFCVGDIDVRSIFLKQLGPDVDFILPFLAADSAWREKRQGQSIPYNLVNQMIEKLIAPLLWGLGFLRHAGFSKVFLHSLPPQTLSDDDFERLNGIRIPVALRYKASLAFNQLLRVKCRELGIGFVDLWNTLTKQDRLRESYFLDHVHLNKAAAFESIALLLEQLTRAYNLAHGSQYEHLHQLGLAHFKARHGQRKPEITAAFAKRHIYQAPGLLPAGAIAHLRDQLDYSLDVGNRHYRLDWVGNAVAPFSDKVLTTELEPDQLRQVYDMVYSPPVKELIESCTGFSYTVLCCRSFRSLPHPEAGSGPQAFHNDGTPPGLLRVIIYLCDVDESNGPFEYIDPETKQSRLVTGPAGSIHIFDANALLHRASPPTQHERFALDLVIFPSLPGVPDCVIWPGMNHWPVDPFHFSIEGYASWPPLAGGPVRASHDLPLGASTPHPLLRQIAQADDATILAIYEGELQQVNSDQLDWLPGLYALALALLRRQAEALGPDWPWLRFFQPEQAASLPEGPLRQFLSGPAGPHPLDPELAEKPHALVLLDSVAGLSQVEADWHDFVLILTSDFDESQLAEIEAASAARAGDNIWLMNLSELGPEQLAALLTYASCLHVPALDQPDLLELRLMALLTGKPLTLGQPLAQPGA